MEEATVVLRHKFRGMSIESHPTLCCLILAISADAFLALLQSRIARLPALNITD